MRKWYIIIEHKSISFI